MTEQNGTPTAPRNPDSIITTQRNGQTIVAELFFNHSSTETFRDKLLKTIPVSYTHLDVYKRQALDCVRIDLIGGGKGTDRRHFLSGFSSPGEDGVFQILFHL